MSDQIARTAAMAADWWAEKLEAGDKEKFRAHLQASVDAELRSRGRVRLMCDYDPQGPLLDAVRAAGVDCRGVMFSALGILPEKHELTVYPDRLEPKEGYGKWLHPIFVA